MRVILQQTSSAFLNFVSWFFISAKSSCISSSGSSFL